MKYDVFISYSTLDQKVVEGVCAHLEQHKIRCFVAYRDIPRGVPWARAIVEALDESRMMLVVFSGNFNNSEQVDREIEIANEDKKPILTFRITDDAFKGAKKYYLKNLNWIDAFPEPSRVFGRMLEDVCKLLDIKLEQQPVTNSEQKQQFVQPAQPSQSQVAKPQPQPAVKAYKVGDYYDDGTKQGVVFDVWDGGRHGKIVSLDQGKGLRWVDSWRDGFGRLGTDSKTDGKANTDKVMARGDANQYPAFVWCRNKGVDWYLPAIDELKLLLNDSVHDAVNITLAQKGGTKLYNKKDWEWYWSSTESDKFCAWYVLMLSGNTNYDDKNYNTYVRAVSAF